MSEARRKGIRLFMKDGRPPRVWEAKHMTHDFATTKLYDENVQEILCVKTDELLAYEYVDLGPVEQPKQNPEIEVQRADN